MIAYIGCLLGIVDATHLRKPPAELRKRNKIKTIRASLAIEGNMLTEEQITAIIEKKGVIGSSKDVLEVKNAIKVYDSLDQFDYQKLSIPLRNGIYPSIL